MQVAPGQAGGAAFEQVAGEAAGQAVAGLRQRFASAGHGRTRIIRGLAWPPDRGLVRRGPGIEGEGAVHVAGHPSLDFAGLINCPGGNMTGIENRSRLVISVV